MSMSFDAAVATNKPKVNAYLDRELHEALEKEARKQIRSKSQMISLLLKEALKSRGYVFTEEDE